MDCALDLMRRLPPQQIEKNLIDLIDLAPALCEDLLTSIDQPLKIAKDKETGKDYLLCDYNRDGDSYRSPWSNTYDPPLEDGSMPSERLRKLEIEANHAFDQYREMYYEGGVSSAYLWDLDHGFAGVILIKKAGEGNQKTKGCWDSIHVVEVQEKSSGRTAHYKLTSTAMLWLQTHKQSSGTINLGGSLTRQVTLSTRLLTLLNATIKPVSPNPTPLDRAGRAGQREQPPHRQYRAHRRGHGEQDPQHAERDLLWQNQRHSQRAAQHPVAGRHQPAGRDEEGPGGGSATAYRQGRELRRGSLSLPFILS